MVVDWVVAVARNGCSSDSDHRTEALLVNCEQTMRRVNQELKEIQKEAFKLLSKAFRD